MEPEQPEKTEETAGYGRSRGRANRRRPPQSQAAPPEDRETRELRELAEVTQRLEVQIKGMDVRDERSSRRDRSRSGTGEIGLSGTSASRRGMRGEQYDFVTTRKPDEDKKGKSGQVIQLVSNYFQLQKLNTWSLYQHRVDFSTEVDRNVVRKKLLRAVAKSIGPYIFDGTLLYATKELQSPLNLQTRDEVKKEDVIIIIKYIGKLIPGDSMYMQFYNIILRKCLFGMKLEELGRHFYDPKQSIKISQHGLELWPGYITSMRNHEQEVLLCVEVTHKVIRLETVLDNIRRLQNTPGDYKKAVSEALIGSIVLTSYNHKTYRIDDIDWNGNPSSTFQKNGEEITYHNYFTSRYDAKISDKSQPLLVVVPSKKDLHRGQTGPILLIPELCQLTGLTDAMRSNFTLMKALAEHLQMPPQKRIEALRAFMGRLLSQRELIQELNDWGLGFTNELVQCEGHVLQKEGLVFGPTSTGQQQSAGGQGAGQAQLEMPNEKADWTMAFRKRQMMKCVHLERWAIIVPQRDTAALETLVKLMIQVSKPLGFIIRQPMEIFKVQDTRSGAYLSALDTLKRKADLQMFFVVLPNNKLELYSAVKKRVTVDFGIPSQCFLSKTLANKGLMSVATKVVVQMNAKLGGEPWSVVMPLKNLMVAGFDAYRGGSANRDKEGSKGAIGALVASLNSTQSKYFSTISKHNGLEDLGNNLTSDMSKSLDAYKLENKGSLPDRILFYRDGVGEGQLKYIFETELEQLKVSLDNYYISQGIQLPKLTYIVVNKKINTRIFTARPDNPPPGTVVDDTITLPERFDFYMVTCAARQGSVSPTAFNVIFNGQKLDADKVQRLTYKFCHLYYNWSGTVAVPAPCQYAHKLAFLAGMALGGQPHPNLQNNLHFL